MAQKTRRTNLPVAIDVAKLAGVSQKTVSRVINNSPSVRPEVRQRVEAAIAELGYQPNAAARALVTKRSRVLGIVTPGTALYGPTAQLFAVERAAWEAGYSVVIASTTDPSTVELERAIRQVLFHGVDGILLVSPVTSGSSGPTVDLHGVPMVSLDPVSDDAASLVLPDQRQGARAAVGHLLSLGHQTVWHVTGPLSWHSAAERERAWRAMLAEHEAPIPEPIIGDWSPASGYAAGRTLAGRHDVTAIFAANDAMAMGIMRALHEHGRRIPDDISVVGFDDVPESEYALIPLTSIRQDFGLVARLAVTELLAAIDGADRKDVDVPVQLVVRASSGPPPPVVRTTDPEDAELPVSSARKASTHEEVGNQDEST